MVSANNEVCPQACGLGWGDAVRAWAEIHTLLYQGLAEPGKSYGSKPMPVLLLLPTPSRSLHTLVLPRLGTHQPFPSRNFCRSCRQLPAPQAQSVSPLATCHPDSKAPRGQCPTASCPDLLSWKVGRPCLSLRPAIPGQHYPAARMTETVTGRCGTPAGGGWA